MKRKKMPEADLETIMPILIGAWRRFHKESGPSDTLQTREFRGVVEAVKQLQVGLGEKNSFALQDYFADRNLLGAYLLYQWVVHYQEGLSLINELPHTPRRVLDICSGPLPYAFAALRHQATEVYAVDRNLTALQLGAEVCGRYGQTVNIRQWDCLKSSCPIEGKFDLIIVGHCLRELFPEQQNDWQSKQNHFLRGLLDRLTPEGFLLIVDNSFVHANRRILQLRDHFVASNVPVQAPCVWKGECPALKTKDSPCYAQREFEKPYLIKEIQRANEINLGSLKMSYIIFKSPQSQWPELPVKPLYRVVSPPIESYQGKRYYLCGTDGKKSLGSHLKQQEPSAKAFEYLRRGELITVENSLEKGLSLDIVQGTKVSVIAACGKPLEKREDEDS